MAGHGIHHVTVIAGKAQGNLDFYTGVLGLRLVKRSVNFDDPGAYHLYYGDGVGAPGTLLTFFPWEHAAPGQLGTGEVQEAAFRVPEAALGFWAARLAARQPRHDTCFGQPVLRFRDPDGLRLALVGLPGIEGEEAWHASGLPPECALRGLHGVTLLLPDPQPTAAVLTEGLGFIVAGRETERVRLLAPGVRHGAVVDLLLAPAPVVGRIGHGTVHHLAFRVADDATQAALARRLAERQGLLPGPQRDRGYFRSVYFREPGGLLFEIATDPPGFLVDEDCATLGAALQLPDFLEAQRAAIARILPPLD